MAFQMPVRHVVQIDIEHTHGFIEKFIVYPQRIKHAIYKVLIRVSVLNILVSLVHGEVAKVMTGLQHFPLVKM